MFDHRSGAHLSAPLHVELAVTSSCQLNCDYCSAAPFSGAIAPLDRIQEIVRELGELQVHSLLLSGGEPTLHPGFLDIARAAAGIPEVLINSNGIRLSHRGYADAFHRAAPDSLVAISIDTPDISINDLHRGAGGEQALRAIGNLIELKHSVCISSVLTPESFDTAEMLIDMFFPSVTNFRFFPQVPTSDENRELVQGAYMRRLDGFYKRLQMRMEQNPLLKLHSPRAAAPEAGLGAMFDGLEHCCCAFSKAYIDSNLHAYPCFYSANKDTCFGDLKHLSFRDAWNGKQLKHVQQKAKRAPLCGVPSFGEAVPHRYSDMEEAHT